MPRICLKLYQRPRPSKQSLTPGTTNRAINIPRKKKKHIPQSSRRDIFPFSGISNTSPTRRFLQNLKTKQIPGEFAGIKANFICQTNAVSRRSHRCEKIKSMHHLSFSSFLFRFSFCGSLLKERPRLFVNAPGVSLLFGTEHVFESKEKLASPLS